MSDSLSDCSDVSYQSLSEDQCQSVNFDLSNGAPLDTNNFIIVHFNINSITAEGRIEQLSDICQTLHVDVLIISESKLDCSIADNSLLLPNFNEPIRRDRDRHGGGCIVYVAQHLSYKHRHDLELPDFEHIWVDVRLKDQLFAINTFYRPPVNLANEKTRFLDFSEQVLLKLDSHNATNKIIACDMNYGNIYCKYPILEPKPLDDTAPDLYSSFGLTQIIDIPTRTTDTTMSLIDLFFTSKPDDVVIQGTLPSIADHEGILCSFNTTEQKALPRTKTIYDYKNIDFIALKKYIKDFDFDSKIFSLPVTEQVLAFTDVLTAAISQFVPTKTFTIRPNDQSWCNAFTRLLLRKKNRSYQFYKKVNSKYLSQNQNQNIDPEIMTKLLNKKNKAFKKSRQAANQSLKANRKAKSNFFNSINSTMTNSNISAKKKFSILIKLMKTNKYTSIPPIIDQNLSVQDPQSKANIFNNFFASKSTVPNPNDEPPILPQKDGVSVLKSINTSPIEVGKIIRTLKQSHMSHCGVPGKFLVCLDPVISKPLSALFNNLFNASLYPDQWKLSHVTPIYKRSGPKCDKSSFRPISLLPTLSKVCESVIHSRLLSHCLENNVISERQGAYLKGDSTIHQLLYIIHHIKQNWGKGHITHGLFLDISAAFDKIWHRGLISKLQQIGIEEKFLDLFKSYLSNRQQVVVVDGFKSNTSEIKAGCPQGSRLGPLLFIIYINDIIYNLESEIIIFADDTTLLASGCNSDETTAQLDRDIIKLINWSSKWKVSFNPKKTKDMIFSNKPAITAPPLMFNDTTIDRVSSHKHLGLYLTPTLDWSAQINYVCLKANRKLNILRSVKGLSRKTLDILYKLTVRSVLDYGLPIYYNNLRQTEIRRLQQLQYRAGKVVCGALHFTSQVKLEKELGWETIGARADILGLSIFHKIALGQTRPLIRKCMPQLDVFRTHITRSNGGFIPFHYTSTTFNNSFFPYHTKLWNSIPKEHKTGDLPTFKDSIKTLFKPTKHKHYSYGSKLGNSFITQLRVGRSYLNGHSHSIGQSESPQCDCGDPHESPQHVLLSCPLYESERLILFNTVLPLIPGFYQKSLKVKTEILLHGISPDNPDSLPKNRLVTLSVQHFLMSIKRLET